MKENSSGRARLGPRVALFAAAAAVVLALASGSAQATAPVMESVDLPLYQNHPTFHWSLPTSDKGTVKSVSLETATSSEVNAVNDGHFLQKNLLTFYALGPTDTSYTDLREYKPGTYFVHVSGSDPKCSKPPPGEPPPCPLIEFSNVLSFTVVAPPPGGGGGGGGGTVDKLAPLETLSFGPVQDIDKLYVTARSTEAGKVSATGTISIPGASKVYRFKRATRSVAANAKTKLRMKLSKKKLRAIKRALKKRKRLKAKITVTVADKAGNKRSQKVVIRVTN
jgi:hypothetical protein